jgi:PadR family transcriptional regulator, regulatory protein PadR
MLTSPGTLLYKGTVMNDTSTNEIRKGLLVLAVLQALSSGKKYTAEILESLNTGEFATQEGTLYPLLSKLKREGYIDHEWVESQSGPPRKYYSLSESGNNRTTELMKYIKKLQQELTDLGKEKS